MSGSLFGPTSPKGGGTGGGGTGTALRVEDEGVLVDANASTLDFTGTGITVTSTAPGAVDVNVPGPAVNGFWAGTVPAASFALVSGVLKATVAFGSPHPSGVQYSVAVDEVVVANSGLSLDLSIENATANGFDIVLNTGAAVPNLIQVDWQVQPHGVVAGTVGGISLPGILNTLIVDKGSNVTEDGSQQFPFHTINAALLAASSGDVILVYPGTYTETITPINGVVLRGVDPDKCILTAPLGSGDLLGTVTAGVDFTIAKLGVIGQIVISGNAAVLRLKDRMTLEGNVDIAAGDGSTELIVTESNLQGVSDFNGTITIGVIDARVTITGDSEVRANVPSNGGPTASIYWGSNNDNVWLAQTLLRAGTASANPLQRSAAQTPLFRSHHCTWNTDPEASGVFTNEITPGQRFDTMSTLARY